MPNDRFIRRKNKMSAEEKRLLFVLPGVVTGMMVSPL
jgi:hypothetical protein